MQLNEKKISIRGVDYAIRELTHKQRRSLTNAPADDKVATMVSLGLIDPPKTVAELDDMPGAVVEQLSREILALSSAGEDGEKKA